MSRVREKKFKKLKKAHIWPAIVFFICSGLLAIIASFLFMVMILSYFAADRIQTTYDNVSNVSSMFSESMDNGTDQMMMRYLERNGQYSDAIYLIDNNNKVLAGFGGPTYDMERAGELSLFNEDSLMFYFDKKSVNGLLNEEGDIQVGTVIWKFFENTPLFSGNVDKDSIVSFGQAWKESWKTKNLIIDEYFWIGKPVSPEKTLLVKCRVAFYTLDIMLVLVMGIASLLVMHLPIIFLFINVLTGVSNQRRMTKLLYMDTVTYGNNWIYFEENAEKILCRKNAESKLFAMVDIALMKYRNFCTYHGVDAGEDLLENVDKYLTTQITKNKELSAHNGRASFALLLQCNGPEGCKKRVEDMLKEMTDKYGHVGIAYHAGIYFIEPSMSADGKRCVRRKDVDIDELYNCANAARTTIPEDNPMEMAVFDQKMLDDKLWEHKVEAKMQAALDNEEFVVYMQPKYNPVTEKLAGAEALVRWINDEDGFVPPGRFIPIFEKNGFITKLDDYMISHVAKLQSQWIAAGKEVVPISVNVSRAHFANANLAEHICELVDKYNAPHNMLEIELTESAFFDDKAALLRTVKKLQEKGFEVSMDDFGAGYSSLNSLKDLPLDVLKLDADFFRGEDGENRGEIVVAEAIALAKKLNMKIVAEGIEKKEQVDFLAKQECDMIQGYYFAKPMPANEYEERL